MARENEVVVTGASRDGTDGEPWRERHCAGEFSEA